MGDGILTRRRTPGRGNHEKPHADRAIKVAGKAGRYSTLKAPTGVPADRNLFTAAGWVREMLLERKTVSIPRACELVGVSRRTIYNWISGGKVQYVRTAGGSVRIFEDTLWRNPDAEVDAHRTAWTERLSRGA